MMILVFKFAICSLGPPLSPPACAAGPAESDGWPLPTMSAYRIGGCQSLLDWTR